MKFLIRHLFVFVAWFQLVLLAYPPLILSSTRVIKGIAKRIDSTKPNPFPGAKIDQLIKQVISHCSSDAYLLINQPGLTNDDFRTNDQKSFFNVQTKLAQDSTVVSFAHIENYLSFDQISRYVAKNCRADVIKITLENEEQVDDGDQLPRYIDSKTRIFVINLPRLPTYGQDYEYRKHILEQHDKYIRRVLQRIPSPYLSFILTSLDTSDTDETFFVGHPKNSLFMKSFKQVSSSFDPINWITTDKRRLNEESLFQEFDFNKPKNRHDIPRQNKYEKFIQQVIDEENEIRLFTKDFFFDNEGIIIGLSIVAVLFGLYIALVTIFNIFKILGSLLAQRASKNKASKEKKDK